MLLALGFGAANALVLSQVGKQRPPDDASTPTSAAVATGPSTAQALAGAPPEPADNHLYDVVITGGRVIDPETRFDRVADVGIDGPTIVAITDHKLNARTTIDAKDRVVAPGFIDMISYDPNSYGIWYKIADGVTTNLGMHGMLMSAEQFFGTYAQQGSPCHYGGAYDNYFMRGDGRFGIGSGEAATPRQLDQLAADIEEQVHQGWIGASFSPEYSPGITDDEIKRQIGCGCEVRAAVLLPRPLLDRRSSRRQREDVARDHRRGAHHRRSGPRHAHHLDGRNVSDAASARHDPAGARPADSTSPRACTRTTSGRRTSSQPASTTDGSSASTSTYSDLVIPGTGERLTAERFDELRSASKNTLVAAYAIPEPDVVTGLQSPMTMIGSDAILTPGDNNHPRGAGCFSRALGHYVREQKTLSLVDALAKMTILPAKRLEAKAPALQKKGRLQRGADADITIFDPDTVADRATVEDPSQTAAGIEYVLVLGTMVLSPDGTGQDQVARPTDQERCI